MDATTCPDCDAPAEILDRDVLESTDGPVEHVRVVCVRRHHFLMSTGSLAAGRRTAPARSEAVRRPVRRPR
jgi:hypothetical protein